MEGMKVETYTERSIVLSGETTKLYKDEIKKLGGKWNGNLKNGLKGWIFSATKLKLVEELIEEAKNNPRTEGDEIEIEDEQEEKQTDKKSTKGKTTPESLTSVKEMKVDNYTDKSIVLHGQDTQTYKDEIKELGGKWNGNLNNGLKGWIFPLSSKDKVVKFIADKYEVKKN